MHSPARRPSTLMEFIAITMSTSAWTARSAHRYVERAQGSCRAYVSAAGRHADCLWVRVRDRAACCARRKARDDVGTMSVRMRVWCEGISIPLRWYVHVKLSRAAASS